MSSKTTFKIYDQFQNRPSLPGETSSQPSKTIPGQSVNIVKLMERFTRGQSVDSSPRSGTYTGNTPDDHPDFNMLDNVDKEVLKKTVADNITYAQAALQHQAAKSRNKKHLDASNDAQSGQQSPTGTVTLKNSLPGGPASPAGNEANQTQ